MSHNWIYLGKLTGTQTPFLSLLTSQAPIKASDYQVKYFKTWPDLPEEFTGEIEFEVEQP